MVGQLGEIGTVGAHGKDVGVYDFVLFSETRSGYDKPMTVGRKLRGGKTASRDRKDYFFNAGLGVYTPDFAFAVVGETGAVECTGIVGVGYGRHPARVVGEQVCRSVVAPDAVGVASFAAVEEYLIAVVGQFARIVVVLTVGNLAYYVSLSGIDKVYAEMSVAVFGETYRVSVRTPRKVENVCAECALNAGAAGG